MRNNHLSFVSFCLNQLGSQNWLMLLIETVFFVLDARTCFIYTFDYLFVIYNNLRCSSFVTFLIQARPVISYISEFLAWMDGLVYIIYNKLTLKHSFLLFEFSDYSLSAMKPLTNSLLHPTISICINEYRPV